MKATVIILSVVLGIILLGGVAFGAYWYGTSQNNTSNSANNNSNNNSSNSNVQPKVVTEPTCNADDLTLTLGEGDGGGAGSLSTSLVFTNSGTRECTLGGYPGVSLVNDNGNQIGSPADRMTGEEATTVTLAVNASATALVTYPEEGNFDAGVCADGATKLRVYPPNDYGYLSVASPITAWCPGFQAGPVTAQ